MRHTATKRDPQKRPTKEMCQANETHSNYKRPVCVNQTRHTNETDVCLNQIRHAHRSLVVASIKSDTQMRRTNVSFVKSDIQMRLLQKRFTAEMFAAQIVGTRTKKDICVNQMRPTKDTYKRNLQKRPTAQMFAAQIVGTCTQKKHMSIK